MLGLVLGLGFELGLRFGCLDAGQRKTKTKTTTKTETKTKT